MKHSFFSLIFLILSGATKASALTLGDLLDGAPPLAYMKPSEKCLHLSDDQAFVEIKGQKFELRYIALTDGKNVAGGKTFSEIVRENGLGASVPKEMAPNPHLKVLAFIQPEALKDKGIYYTISVRPVN